jgi:hypothetical protein
MYKRDFFVLGIKMEIFPIFSSGDWSMRLHEIINYYFLKLNERS